MGGSSTYVNMLGVGSGDLDVSEGLNEEYEISSYPDGPVVFLNPVLLDHGKPYFAGSGFGFIIQSLEMLLVAVVL